MKLAAVALLAISFAVTGCSGSICPEGQHYVSDPPLIVPVFNGKTTTMTVIPQGHCEGLS